jgi:hypothetical protein
MASDMTYTTPNGYRINFYVELAPMLVSKISDTILHVIVLDSMGIEVLNFNIPDYMAYELSYSLEAMSLAEDNDLGSINTRTIELPPNQGIRYSIILLRNVETPILMKVVETNMINARHACTDLVLDINDAQFGKFLGMLYENFQMTALIHGVPPMYYYENLQDFFNE